MVLSIGEILVDIFDDGSTKKAYPGGAPFNVACNLARFNNKEVGFLGSIGKDEYGKMLKEYATKSINHLYLNELDNYHTSEAIVTLKDGERSFRFNRESGADYHLDISTLKDIDLSSVNIVHIGSLMLSFKEGIKFFEDAVAFLRQYKHVKISFDVNYRDDIFSSEDEAKKVFLEALRKVDIIKFTSEELDLLTGKKNIKESLETLLSDSQLAVVTLGKEGSIYKYKDKYIKVESYPLKPIDTTGAGDAFYSYFLYELDKGLDILDESLVRNALLKANVVGALATQRKGAIGVVPSLKELKYFIKKVN